MTEIWEMPKNRTVNSGQEEYNGAGTRKSCLPYTHPSSLSLPCPFSHFLPGSQHSRNVLHRFLSIKTCPWEELIKHHHEKNCWKSWSLVSVLSTCWLPLASVNMTKHQQSSWRAPSFFKIRGAVSGTSRFDVITDTAWSLYTRISCTFMYAECRRPQVWYINPISISMTSMRCAISRHPNLDVSPKAIHPDLSKSRHKA